MIVVVAMNTKKEYKERMEKEREKSVKKRSATKSQCGKLGCDTPLSAYRETLESERRWLVKNRNKKGVKQKARK